MKVLIVGGAGFIGSHMVKLLAKQGNEVVVLDNLSTGFSNSVKYGQLIVGDIADIHLLENIFLKHDFDSVMHFAANSLVGESMTNPSKYYQNNVANTLNLLDVMIRHNVKKIIFSSTAAIFGDPVYTPIDESHPQSPINPYGVSKMMIEYILKDYAYAYGLSSVSLRYFNACGADPDGELGENHYPETHLIPLILQVASGRRKSITVFGRDYDTPDGTCIRDYIHVNDLCTAHGAALDLINSDPEIGALAFNLGSGSGFSVQQVLDVVNEVVNEDGVNIKVCEGPRRVGDPAILIADSFEAQRVLGWQPKYNDLEIIVRHAWAWEQKRAIS